jgi:hypothetical protein
MANYTWKVADGEDERAWVSVKNLRAEMGIEIDPPTATTEEDVLA